MIGVTRNKNRLGKTQQNRPLVSSLCRDDTDHGNPKQHPDVPHTHTWGKDGRGQAVPGSKPQDNKKEKRSGWARAGVIATGVAVIFGTIVEDIGTQGTGISNDVDHFQKGIQLILYGVSH